MADPVKPTPETCGIVMPLSPIDGCDEQHWEQVQDIISDSAKAAGFEPALVSSADEVGVIQKRIIQNLYDNPIVVCDVSAKNPNVMFELGIRLAFDKPTIIIKDDKTNYSFDTAPIEHLGYPRDLRFHDVVKFKERLTAKIKATVSASKADAEYTPFLGHFGTFKVAKIDSKEVSGDELIIDEIREIRAQLSSMRHSRVTDLDDITSVIRAKDGRDLSAFAVGAKRSIRRYAKDHTISLRALTTNDDAFVAFVEEQAQAPEFFRRKQDFISYLSLLLTMV